MFGFRNLKYLSFYKYFLDNNMKDFANSLNLKNSNGKLSSKMSYRIFWFIFRWDCWMCKCYRKLWRTNRLSIQYFIRILKISVQWLQSWNENLSLFYEHFRSLGKADSWDLSTVFNQCFAFFSNMWKDHTNTSDEFELWRSVKKQCL